MLPVRERLEPVASHRTQCTEVTEFLGRFLLRELIMTVELADLDQIVLTDLVHGARPVRSAAARRQKRQTACAEKRLRHLFLRIK